jgi:hypothetical protein
VAQRPSSTTVQALSAFLLRRAALPLKLLQYVPSFTQKVRILLKPADYVSILLLDPSLQIGIDGSIDMKHMMHPNMLLEAIIQFSAVQNLPSLRAARETSPSCHSEFFLVQLWV